MMVPMHEPVYSIIVPAYNEAEELPRTIESLRAAMRAEAALGELIVVNNNSTDATAAVARSHNADQVVFEPVNQIARARNAGARAARGRHLFFVDADTRISPELLRESLRRLETGSSSGGGAIVCFEGPISILGKLGIGLWKCISTLTRTAAGSYLFCRRDAFEAVGGFDEKLYASEEVRLSSMLRKWGRRQAMPFDIITGYPVYTSARKLKWYSGPKIIGWALLMVLVPVAVRSRKLCGFWYDRPERGEKT